MVHEWLVGNFEICEECVEVLDEAGGSLEEDVGVLVWWSGDLEEGGEVMSSLGEVLQEEISQRKSLM